MNMARFISDFFLPRKSMGICVWWTKFVHNKVNRYSTYINLANSQIATNIGDKRSREAIWEISARNFLLSLVK